MTEIGKVVDGKILGIKAKNKYIYSPCSICGKPRWTTYAVKKQKANIDKCLSCSIKLVHERNRLKIESKGKPFVGEVRRGREIGSKDKKHPYIFSKCPVCGIERWVTFRGGKSNPMQRCQACSAKAQVGTKASNWKGGRVKHSEGYIEVKVYPEDFYYSMANSNGYVIEHRLLMAKKLKRCLLPWEVVHHRNGVRDDNRLENLQLLPTRKYHITDTVLKSHVKKMQKRIAYLEKILTNQGISF